MCRSYRQESVDIPFERARRPLFGPVNGFSWRPNRKKCGPGEVGQLTVLLFTLDSSVRLVLIHLCSSHHLSHNTQPLLTSSLSIHSHSLCRSQYTSPLSLTTHTLRIAHRLATPHPSLTNTPPHPSLTNTPPRLLHTTHLPLAHSLPRPDEECASISASLEAAEASSERARERGPDEPRLVVPLAVSGGRAPRPRAPFRRCPRGPRTRSRRGGEL